MLPNPLGVAFSPTRIPSNSEKIRYVLRYYVVPKLLEMCGILNGKRPIVDKADETFQKLYKSVLNHLPRSKTRRELDIWVTHELNVENFMQRFSFCEPLVNLNSENRIIRDNVMPLIRDE